MGLFDLNDYDDLIDKAIEFYYDEKPEDAFTFLNMAYAIDKTTDAMLLYAKLYYEIGAYDRAIQKCYEIIIKEKKRNDALYEVYTLLFKIYFFEERFDLADKCFLEVRRLEESPGFIDRESYYYDGIDAFLDAQKIDEQAFSVVDKEEEELRRRLREVFLCFSRDENEKALKILKKDLEKNKSPRQYNLLFFFYMGAHKYTLAGKVAEKMLEYPETKLFGILNLIHFGIVKDDRALIEDCFLKLKTIKINDEDSLERIVETLTATECHEVVEEYVLKLMKYRPYDINCLYIYACALYNGGKREEAREVYKKIHLIYGDYSRAQFFLKGGKEMAVRYNSPLPFAYFGVFSRALEVMNQGTERTLLSSPESREMLYIALMSDEVGKDVLDYLLTFLSEKNAEDLLKRFFLDIEGSAEFKEYAAFKIIALGAPFDFAFIARDGCGILNYDGNFKITKNSVLNGAYVYLLLRMLFYFGGNEPVDTEIYKEYFAALEKRLDAAGENSKVKKSDFKSERGIAAAVFYKANGFKKGDGERVAALFGVSSALTRKFVKMIDELE
ncbi:MAG: hypothetical protein LBP62_08480 [Clostridiales bacterium]|jgi:tetratricopeptide (TPR) repeat protein|nr:hypothetical protein [Clostridiales bacterium]